MDKFYQASDILFWTSIELWSDRFQPETWWQILNSHSDPSQLPHTSFDPAYNQNLRYQNVRYILPVVELVNNCVKVIKPLGQIFVYNGRKINGYSVFYNKSHLVSYSYLWVANHCVVTQPSPCLRCGWYCQQSCQTWNFYGYNLFLS